MAQRRSPRRRHLRGAPFGSLVLKNTGTFGYRVQRSSCRATRFSAPRSPRTSVNDAMIRASVASVRGFRRILIACSQSKPCGRRSSLIFILYPREALQRLRAKIYHENDRPSTQELRFLALMRYPITVLLRPPERSSGQRNSAEALPVARSPSGTGGARHESSMKAGKTRLPKAKRRRPRYQARAGLAFSAPPRLALAVISTRSMRGIHDVYHAVRMQSRRIDVDFELVV